MGYTKGYIKQNLREILGKIKGYIGQKLWDILWDIFVKSSETHLSKLRDIPYFGLIYPSDFA